MVRRVHAGSSDVFGDDDVVQALSVEGRMTKGKVRAQRVHRDGHVVIRVSDSHNQRYQVHIRSRFIRAPLDCQFRS